MPATSIAAGRETTALVAAPVTSVPAHSALVSVEVLERRRRDRGGELFLPLLRCKITRFCRVHSEADLDQHRRHECGDEDAEARLLDAPVGPGVFRREMT